MKVCLALLICLNIFSKTLDFKTEFEGELKYLVSSIGLELDSGLRFAVPITVHIKLDDLGIINTPYDCGGDSNIVQFDPTSKKLILNSNLQAHLNKNIFISDDSCSFFNASKNAFEKALEQIPNVYRLDKPFDLNIEKSINRCKRAIKNNRSNLKRSCSDLDYFLIEQQKKYRFYNLRKKRLLYNTESIHVDPTSLSQENLNFYKICHSDYEPDFIVNGKKRKMLGMAMVYMAAGFATSQLGHTAERFVFCTEDRLTDVLYDYTQVRDQEIVDLKSRFKNELRKGENISSTDDFISSLAGKTYIRRLMNPGSEANYGNYQSTNNRDVIEVWLPANAEQIKESLTRATSWYNKQRSFIAKREIEEWDDYKLISNNCTHPIKETLNSIGGEFSIGDKEGLTPGMIYKFLKKKPVDKIIIYPSQRTLRQYFMVEGGQKIAGEKWSFLTKASNPKVNKAVIAYPEYRGPEGVVLNRLVGAVNTVAGVSQLIGGVIKSPFDKGAMLDRGAYNTVSSLAEILGFRQRYLERDVWTEQESNFVRKVMPFKKPAIVDYLKTKLNN